jgi:hypothetical protein
MNRYFLIPVILSLAASVQAEAVPDPNRGLYAIWVRSVDTGHLPFLKGGQAVVQWKEIQPEEGRYDFSKLRAQLEELDRLGRVTTVQLNANQHPEFLFNKVPHHPEALGIEQDKKGTLQYWHPDYIKAYTDLIVAFAREVKSSPYRSRVIGIRFNYNAIGTEWMVVKPDKRDPAQWIAPAGVTPAPAWTEEIATAYRHTIQEAYLKNFSPELRVFMRSGLPGYNTPDQDSLRLVGKGELGIFTTGSEIEPRTPSMLDRNVTMFEAFCRPGKTVCYAESKADALGQHGGLKDSRWCSPPQYNYWRLLADLNLGFSMLGVYGADLENAGNPEYRAAFDFAARYAGYHASPSVAPGAWVALREGSLLQKGDYSFLMRRLPGAVMKPEEKIGPDDQRFGAWALTLPKGAEAKFALDPAFARSLKKATVRVTYLDRGAGTFALLGHRTKLTGSERWKTAEFVVTQPSAEFAITADTDLTLHMIEISR